MEPDLFRLVNFVEQFLLRLRMVFCQLFLQLCNFISSVGCVSEDKHPHTNWLVVLAKALIQRVGVCYLFCLEGHLVVIVHQNRGTMRGQRLCWISVCLWLLGYLNPLHLPRYQTFNPAPYFTCRVQKYT